MKNLHCDLNEFMVFKPVDNLVRHGIRKIKSLFLQWDTGCADYEILEILVKQT